MLNFLFSPTNRFMMMVVACMMLWLSFTSTAQAKPGDDDDGLAALEIAIALQKHHTDTPAAETPAATESTSEYEAAPADPAPHVVTTSGKHLTWDASAKAYVETPQQATVVQAASEATVVTGRHIWFPRLHALFGKFHHHNACATAQATTVTTGQATTASQPAFTSGGPAVTPFLGFQLSGPFGNTVGGCVGGNCFRR